MHAWRVFDPSAAWRAPYTRSDYALCYGMIFSPCIMYGLTNGEVARLRHIPYPHCRANQIRNVSATWKGSDRDKRWNVMLDRHDMIYDSVIMTDILCVQRIRHKTPLRHNPLWAQSTPSAVNFSSFRAIPSVFFSVLATFNCLLARNGDNAECWMRATRTQTLL